MTNNSYPANRRKEYSSQGRKRQLKENIREKRNKIIGAQDMVTATTFLGGHPTSIPTQASWNLEHVARSTKKKVALKCIIRSTLTHTDTLLQDFRLLWWHVFMKEEEKADMNIPLNCWAKLPNEKSMRHHRKASCTPAGLGHQSSSTKDIRIASRVWIELPVSFITITLKIQMGIAVLCWPFC